MKQTIGIVGGMGPAATSLLFSLIVNKTKASSDNEHIHVLIDNNTNIPDRSKAILEDEISPIDEIILSINKLKSIGASFIIIPCNTAHYYYDEIINKVDIKVLNMLDLVAKRCNDLGINRVAILGTNGTYKTKIYDKYLAKYHINVIYPNELDQDKIMNGIYSYIKAGIELPKDYFKEILENLKNDGALGFILGCTELCIGLNDYKNDYLMFDSLEILAESSIIEAGYDIRRCNDE